MKKHPGRSVIWNNGYKAYWAGRKLDHYQPAEWQRGWRIGQEEDEKQKDQEAAKRRLNPDTTSSSTEPFVRYVNDDMQTWSRDSEPASSPAPSDPSPSVESGGGSSDGGGASGSWD